MADSKYFAIPFATSGDKTVIPEAATPSGAVSYTQGFGPDYERDPATDPLAKRVPRNETNEVLFEATKAIKYLQLYGMPEWFAVDDSGNPVTYSKNAWVRRTVTGVTTVWVSLVDGNTATPGTDATKWVGLSPEILQGGTWNYAVATGTANAWTVAPALAVPAYAAGRVLNIIAPATNTSATVNVNISGLGNRRIKKSNGIDPVAGDLVAGQMYPTIDDGTNIRILVPVPSDRLSAAYLGFHGDGVSISYAHNVSTLINAYGASPINNLPGASYASGIITIGTSGFYLCSANMLSLMPGSANYGFGLAVSKVDAGGLPLLSYTGTQITVSTASLPGNLSTSVGAIAKLTAGDRIAGFFRHNQGTAQNATISMDIEFRGA